MLHTTQKELYSPQMAADIKIAEEKSRYKC